MRTELGLHSNCLSVLFLFTLDCFEVAGLLALALTLQRFGYFTPVILLAWMLTLVDLVDRTFYRALRLFVRVVYIFQVLARSLMF